MEWFFQAASEVVSTVGSGDITYICLICLIEQLFKRFFIMSDIWTTKKISKTFFHFSWVHRGGIRNFWLESARCHTYTIRIIFLHFLNFFDFFFNCCNFSSRIHILVELASSNRIFSIFLHSCYSRFSLCIGCSISLFFITIS